MLKQLGAIYIILGTCIAAGLLGLPIITAGNNFTLTIVMVVSAWALMTLGAWCFMCVNLWLPKESNLISMAQVTLGPWAKRLTWVVYLLLLYSLICAYLAASGDVIESLLLSIHITISRTSATLLSMLGCGWIIYRGIRTLDLCNRVLMSVKLILCLSLITLVAPHVHLQPLMQGHYQWHANAFLVIICSFGYAIIIPSIRDYLGGEQRVLARVVLMGSVIPLVLYLVWIAVIQGSITRFGAHGLLAMQGAAHTNSLLMSQLVAIAHQPLLSSISVTFISICSLTGLLGVSLCMKDFLRDGLQLAPSSGNRIALVALTLVPSGLIVILDPALFTKALAYAGLCCLYILVLLPIVMYWRGRQMQLCQMGIA